MLRFGEADAVAAVAGCRVVLPRDPAGGAAVRPGTNRPVLGSS